MNRKEYQAQWMREKRKKDPVFRERERIAHKKWLSENKDKVKIYNDSRKDIKAKWIREKRKKDPAYKKLEYDRHLIYHYKRIKRDLNYKVRHILRQRIVVTICRGKKIDKAYKTIELLGCSIQQAREHIEKQFKEGMTWENHGTHGWHIDHIIPCAKFDLTDPEEQKKAFHYTNLQPLWAEENLKKGMMI